MKLSTQENSILSLISHDLKSPLNGILGFSELLEKELISSDSNLSKMAHHIKNAGSQMLQLVESILTMAKMEAGKEVLELKEVVDLEAQFKETIQVFELEAKAKNVQLTLDIEKSLPVVYWDIFRLRLHAFNNIISNGLRHSENGGVLLIRVRKIESDIKIEFEDRGCGIPAEQIETIFSLYESSHSSRKSGGHGLGLYNTRLFVESHGGKIYAENVIDKDEIKGARFTMELPIRKKIVSYNGVKEYSMSRL